MRAVLPVMKRSFSALIALCALCIILYSYHGLTNMKCNCPISYYPSKRSSYILQDRGESINNQKDILSGKKLLEFFTLSQQHASLGKENDTKRIQRIGDNDNNDNNSNNNNNTWIARILDKITMKDIELSDNAQSPPENSILNEKKKEGDSGVTVHSNSKSDRGFGLINRLMVTAGLTNDNNILNKSTKDIGVIGTSPITFRPDIEKEPSIQTSYSDDSPDKEQCQPVDRVFFLKTHKTGGSTLTNLLNRFADKKQLNVVLPKDPTLYNFEWPNKFRFSYTRPLYGLTPNILCNHARFNKRAVNWMFPPDQSAYITILRNPVEQYESTFNFMQFGSILGYRKKNSLRFFLRSKPKVSQLRDKMRMNPALYLIKNPMFFDLGLDFKYHENATAIDKAIEEIERSFKAVLLMEYFDESMILLKRTLCWSLKDVLYFKLNQRRHRMKAGKLSKLDKVRIKKWNEADVKLYEHFNRTFWRKVHEQGEEFNEDLKFFRLMNQDIAKGCLAKGEYVEEAYGGIYVKGFSLRSDVKDDIKQLCTQMMTKELSYLDYWRKITNHKLSSIEEPDEQLS